MHVGKETHHRTRAAKAETFLGCHGVRVEEKSVENLDEN
jgi:hypothetical protein